MANLSAVDLFSGCGGLTLGLKWAGFKVVAAIDNDPIAGEAYKANHPEVRLFNADIREIPAERLRDELALKKGELDLLAGCPPCQGFSTIRTLNGSRKIHDSSNDLIFQFIKFIEELLPKALLLENVPGLVKDHRLVKFCNTLRAFGYEFFAPKLLDAADYSVPQRRLRMILIASRFGCISFAKPCSDRITVRDTIGSMESCNNSNDPLHNIRARRSDRIQELINSIPKDGGSRTDLPADQQLSCHRDFNGFKDVYGKMKWDNIAPTLTTGCYNPSKGRFLHPAENRAITMREAALLQSFPIDYIFPSKGKTIVSKLIGNALPPRFVASHANEISSYLKKYWRMIHATQVSQEA